MDDIDSDKTMFSEGPVKTGWKDLLNRCVLSSLDVAFNVLQCTVGGRTTCFCNTCSN